MKRRRSFARIRKWIPAFAGMTNKNHLRHRPEKSVPTEEGGITTYRRDRSRPVPTINAKPPALHFLNNPLQRRSNRCPLACTVARHPGGITVVAPLSSIMAGPSTLAPGPTSLRSYTQVLHHFPSNHTFRTSPGLSPPPRSASRVFGEYAWTSPSPMIWIEITSHSAAGSGLRP